MIGKLEQRILETILNNYQKQLSINHIASLLNTSYPSVHAKTAQLISQGILTQEKIGNATICRLNLENDVLRNILGHIALLKRNAHIKKNHQLLSLSLALPNISKSFSLTTAFFHNQTIYICLNNPFEETPLRALIKQTAKLSNGQLRFISNKELALNLSPSLISEHIILYNPENYYTLLAEKNSAYTHEL